MFFYYSLTGKKSSDNIKMKTRNILLAIISAAIILALASNISASSTSNTSVIFNITQCEANATQINNSDGSFTCLYNNTNNTTDITPPGSITNLTLTSKSENSLYWTWNNPTDSDFSKNIIHINGVPIAETSYSFYNATGLIPNTTYTITIHTKDTSGNINHTDVSNTATTDPHQGPNPPQNTTNIGTITNLTLAAKSTTWLYFTWNNPTECNFNSSIIYWNGINVLNTSNSFYNATNLTPNTQYTITINTKDNCGHINYTNVSLTARTDALPNNDTDDDDNGDNHKGRINNEGDNLQTNEIIFDTSLLPSQQTNQSESIEVIYLENNSKIKQTTNFPTNWIIYLAAILVMLIMILLIIFLLSKAF